MKALITGASSGIGRDMARYMSSIGYDLVIVARSKEPLEELKRELKTNITIEICDISFEENCLQLFEKYKDVNIVINNAGFGVFGEFDETDLEKEIQLINTNVTAVHILTKLYIKEMEKRGSGHIMNVGSIAGLMSGGPLMAAYYASKSYLVSLSRAINKELKKRKSNIRITILCPGPVNTNFNNVAGVKFGIKPLSSEFVAKFGVDRMLKNREIIIPGFINKLAVILSKFSPWLISSEVIYHTQKKKVN